MTFPITDHTGRRYVPDWLDELSPDIARARKDADAARDAATAARTASTAARKSFYALAKRDDSGAFVARDDTPAVEFDDARLAMHSAEAATNAAEKAASRAQADFHDAANEALDDEDADLRGTLLSRWRGVDNSAQAAWREAQALLEARAELDRIVGCRTLPDVGRQLAIQDATRRGEPVLIRSLPDEAGFGSKYALAKVDEHFARAVEYAPAR